MSVKIEAYEAESGKACPALVSIPGAAVRVNAFKLVAVTGDRFLNSFHVPPSTQVTVPAKRPRSTATPADAAETTGPAGDAERASASSDGEAAAMGALVDILNGCAPERLSVPALLDLADAAHLNMADAVLAGLPEYVKPLFKDGGSIELDEVRTRPRRVRRPSRLHRVATCMYGGLTQLSWSITTSTCA